MIGHPTQKLATAPLRFAGQAFLALNSGALYWPARRTLLVADLHFGKAEAIARRGGALLPPFGDLDTLARLDAALFFCKPERVISLGDAFHDMQAASALPPQIRSRLTAMAQACDWVWIGGNHDPGALPLPGRQLPELIEDGIALRHVAQPVDHEKGGDGAGGDGAEGLPDISGHYHPKLRLAGRACRAFLAGEQHLILPAFGTYTGGLEADHPALRALTVPGIAHVLGPKILRVPLGARA